MNEDKDTFTALVSIGSYIAENNCFTRTCRQDIKRRALAFYKSVADLAYAFFLVVSEG